MKGKLIIFSAPSGAGKTTLVKAVMQTSLPLSFSVSATSRFPRDNETDGVDYYFLSPEKFRELVNQEAFLEWEEVYENQYYGTLKSEVERIRSKGHHVVFDVDVVGGLNIKKIYGKEALAIFVMPPSTEVLAQRLSNRGTENQESFNKRLQKAQSELSFASQFDCIIVNDNLDETILKTIKTINDFLSRS
ncbi:MAG: guanylate kinase [Bacteroidales bacterium]|nr:guanylate kinase [Bacteroidales bacterium]